VAEPIEIDGQELLVTASAGISLYPQDGPDVETLLKNADAAMYRAKEKGRNNFQFYTAEMNRQVNERLRMETSLRRALDRNEFELYTSRASTSRTARWWVARRCCAGSIPTWASRCPSVSSGSPRKPV